MGKSEQLADYWMQEVDRKKAGNWLVNRIAFHEKDGAKVAQIRGEGTILSEEHDGEEDIITYRLCATFLVHKQHATYHEEEVHTHIARMRDGQIIHDERVEDAVQPHVQGLVVYESNDQDFDRQFTYDRRAAVQYAERWWNDYNPAYKKFEVDCTNYISQCLRAGGAPMRGEPDRNSGWWFNGENWSYSFTVANALRWYLSGSKQGLRGKEVADARLLRPGDVICYDFEGDGNYNHNTIVVARNAQGEPLVNAHTANSRMRHWAYVDSPAYTKNVVYKFFQIGQ
ncbi:hypothetical protein CHH91_11970 [Virgibacillus sp. 7505]|uniref:amidase domain-containing protein n=1 Tax=Virgibacillus sp. 7505 TaxID=2022548 RepID=UPI000BA7C8FB|nr:amidase domain-containing protein [Virgibacillus sp. 7505]PAE15908.1 hypothetical protein CHH91_11970 [Virgibacillus sp. 7505]